MKLKTLLKDIPNITVKGSKEVEILGITAHAQSVAPGDLFLAKKGMTHDGGQFIPDALSAGARVVVTDVYNPYLQGAVQVIHPDPNALESLFANRFFSSPSKELFLVGITGTNGKTTTAYLARHLLDTLCVKAGLIGTVEWLVGDKVLPATATTPDVITTQKLLREMVDCKDKGAVMEVSSHALEQKRVEGLDFDVAVFTNLTQDHLDYHGSMEAYAAAKAKLFAQVKNIAIINVDDPYAEKITTSCTAKRLTYGIDINADLRAYDIVLNSNGTSARLSFEGKEVRLSSPLIGRFNIYNCLAAVGVGLAYGATLEECARALSTFSAVPGRMERVAHPKGIHIFIDYSHTEDSLKNALITLREFAQKRIITVFGCGGDRDCGKRPKMGRIAEQLSDVVVVTSDNPRTEDPHVIVQEICSGLQAPHKAHIEVNRKHAIEWAVEYAQEGDIVLIAGKGHETCQILAHETIVFDDRLIALGGERSR